MIDECMPLFSLPSRYLWPLGNLWGLKASLVRERAGLDAEAAIDRFIGFLRENLFTAYFDDATQCVAIVMPAGKDRPMATLATLAITKSGWLTNVAENVSTLLIRTTLALPGLSMRMTRA